MVLQQAEVGVTGWVCGVEVTGKFSCSEFGLFAVVAMLQDRL